METLGLWLLGIYFLGFVTSMFVLKARAGIPNWGRPKVFGPDGFGLWWFIQAGVKAYLWPIFLVHWFATGQPEPRIVFNEKAQQRAAAKQAAANAGRTSSGLHGSGRFQ